jgi:hypothetical protein
MVLRESLGEKRIERMRGIAWLKKGAYLGSALLVLAAGSTAQARSDFCQRLRFKCEHKYELGEEGRGNCRRFKEICVERRVDCRALRFRCEHKDEFGERGHGNCRRFYELCT